MFNYILLHKIMWRLSATPRDGTLSPMMLVKDLDLGICKEFYSTVFKSLWLEFKWRGIPIYSYMCVYVCVYIYIFATVIGKDKPELAKKTAQFLSTFKGFQFSSVTQSCPTLCDPMNCSTLGLPVHHQLPEFTQTHCLLIISGTGLFLR